MISVIIPTYGTPDLLDKAIESVLQQTYTDWELIIVDDNNPDTEARRQTEKLVCTFTDSRIKYIRHTHNKNGAAARNTGIRAAKGDYISFLDSDDQYIKTRLEKCFAELACADPSVGGVYTGCEFRRNGKTYLRYKDVKTGKFLVETLSCTFMFCTGSNIFVRKSVIEELRGFDETFLRHQDYEFLVRLFQRYSLVAIPEILVIKNNDNVNLPDVHKVADIKDRYLGKYKNLIDTLASSDVCSIYHANYVAVAELALKSDDKGLAKIYYKKSGLFKPLGKKELLRRMILSVSHGLIFKGNKKTK